MEFKVKGRCSVMVFVCFYLFMIVNFCYFFKINYAVKKCQSRF